MTATSGRVAVALLVALSLAVGATPAAAQSSDQPEWADDLFGELEEMQPRYNANVTETDMNFAERQVYNQLTGEVVNVYFVETDVVFSFYMRRDGTIANLRQSGRNDADLKMEMTRETAEGLVERDDPVPPFVAAVNDGRVVQKNNPRIVRGIVISGENGKPIKQATWTVINTLKGLA